MKPTGESVQLCGSSPLAIMWARKLSDFLLLSLSVAFAVCTTAVLYLHFSAVQMHQSMFAFAPHQFCHLQAQLSL